MQGISLTKKAGLRPALADPDGPFLSQVQPNTAQLRASDALPAPPSLPPSITTIALLPTTRAGPPTHQLIYKRVSNKFTVHLLKDVRNFAGRGDHRLLWLKATTSLSRRGAISRT